MIRFCDKDVFCVEYGRIDRSELLRYFLDGNLDEVVCVLDADGTYFGHIPYQVFVQNENTEQAILRDCLVLDNDIWKNGRMLFAIYKAQFAGNILLPVVDKNQRLLCFAYEEQDANRNLRMLRELQEKADAYQFADIYPEYRCVKIHEFNELAYFFAKYLLSQKIPVQVEGSMWEGFVESDTEEYLDYSCMSIYAEGVWNRPSHWVENLLRSVSVEFECIDHIYEENIKAGIIKNAEKDRLQFLDYLRNEGQVVILGTDIAALDTYNFFKKQGIEIACFASDKYDDKDRILFGKKVLKIIDVMAEYSRPIFVNPYETGSAWGVGGTDRFDYMGYERNKNFFLLNDYVQLEGDGLTCALEDQTVFLMGDVLLCEKLVQYLDKRAVDTQHQYHYVQIPGEKDEDIRLNTVNIKDIKNDALCLIVLPEYFREDWKKVVQERKEKIVTYLLENGCMHYTDYFSHIKTFIHMEKETKQKYQSEFLKPQRIVLGAINACSGNVFFRGLLDGHPSLMMMDYTDINSNLFWFCVRLSGRDVSEIPSLFLKLYHLEWKWGKLKDIDAFLVKMRRLLENKKTCTSQELFVILHMAYMYMYGRDFTDIKDVVIYWEPHHISSLVMEQCTEWLGGSDVPCDILRLVRNMYMSNGSNVKGILDQNFGEEGTIFQIAITGNGYIPAIDDRVYKGSKKVVVRFEDVKCRPEEELGRICKEWGIPWSDSLLGTTSHGEDLVYDNGKRKVVGFDLEPVYNTYEEYFSETDKLKIAISCSPYQKTFGYPYVDVCEYSKRELQELFLKKCRFEQRLHFDTERTRLLYRIYFQNYIRILLQKIRMLHHIESRNDQI